MGRWIGSGDLAIRGIHSSVQSARGHEELEEEDYDGGDEDSGEEMEDRGEEGVRGGQVVFWLGEFSGGRLRDQRE